VTRHRPTRASRSGVQRWLVGAAMAPVMFIGLGGSPASAHPLGNFSVNHLDTLTFADDQIIGDIVIDIAEIPTAQDRPVVDTDGDGAVSPAELVDHGANECAAFVDAARLTVDGTPAAFVVDSSSYTYESGQAGLETSRLECRLVADVAVLVDATNGALRESETALVVEFSDGYRSGRVGWHEINAVEQGSSLIDSPVPITSVTDGLRTYPVELLESPLDVRTARFDVEFGTGAATAPTPVEAVGNASESRDSLVASRPGALGGFVDGVQDRFEDVIGRRDLTLGVGLLAIGLALVLGASHALLPGHGKTVMAAYIAGRQGSVRDAVLVGVTVTATHTGGVLLLGLGLTISTSLAGETVLGWLGVISGALVAALGLALLVSAARHRGGASALFGHGHTHGPHGHTHGPDGHTQHRVSTPLIEHVAVAHENDRHEGAVSHGALLEAVQIKTHQEHDHEHHHHHHEHSRQVPRRGLVGMGVAGGLVPSPSALIVLLSAIALGRTWFGIVLVVGYGVGMAATLTAAGILLVKVRDRWDARLSGASGRAAGVACRWSVAMPYVTAALVFVVGLGLAIRSFVAL